MSNTICPLARTATQNLPCMLNACGMYDEDNKQCAVKTIAQGKEKKAQAKSAK